MAGEVPDEAGSVPTTQLLVRFTALGRETALVSDWSISSSFMTSTDGFEFTLYDSDPDNLRRLELQPVELIVGDRLRVVGRIDGTRRGRTPNTVVCRGRDFIADIVESNVDPTLRIQGGDNVLLMVGKAASSHAIDTIGADDGAMRNLRSGVKVRARKKQSKAKSRKLNDHKPQPGQGVYEFVNKILAREAVTIQPGPNRQTVILATPNYEQDPFCHFYRTADNENGSQNNILSAEADRDFSSFPTYVIVQGAQAKAGQKGEHATQTFDMWTISARFSSELGQIMQDVTVSGRWPPGKPPATEVRNGALYRLLVFRDDDARNADQIEAAAKRAIAERLKETLNYRVTLKGHLAAENEAMYTIDTMIRVDDDIADIHEVLWVESCTLQYSEKEGATTDLVCWRPESFELDEPYQPGQAGPPPKKEAAQGPTKTAPLFDLTSLAREEDDKARLP